MKNHVVVQKPSMTIIGIECRTSNAPDAAPNDIPKHWLKFYTENTLSKIPNKAVQEVVALYCNYEGDHTKPYSLIIGCPVTSTDNIPKGMVAKIIPASTYNVFNAVGPMPQSILKTWEEIWTTGLDRTYTGDFEVYGNKFFSGSPQEVKIFIATKP